MMYDIYSGILKSSQKHFINVMTDPQNPISLYYGRDDYCSNIIRFVINVINVIISVVDITTM